MKNNEFLLENDFNSIIDNYRAGRLSHEKAKELLESLKIKKEKPLTATLSSNTRPVPDDSRSLTISDRTDGIAVIGLSGLFPRADNKDAFWQNLINGHNAAGDLPQEYLRLNLPPGYGDNVKPYRWGGFLEERDCFDPLFFQITPREAKSMNPHQRLILQESWKALEDAGINPDDLSGSSVGIYIGAEPTGYFYETFTGYSDAIVASRLSYFLNLQGPAIVVNTACSSSGTAIHLACESLRSNEISMALAGGVYAKMDQPTLIKMAEVGMLSPTGVCRAFDEDGDGTVMSEGVGVVVLKRLKDAIADHDMIYGVIIGSGVNQDGASNGITAPNGLAQEKLVKAIYERFAINPEEITYVEAHGTGTKLGDPVEANSLVHVYNQCTNSKNHCAVGSAKSHIGHTGAAACVISLIKVLLSMQHAQIPGLINFKKLNPLIEFDNSPFFVNTEKIDWRSFGHSPLTAAINSFGHSGTNVHLVIREYVDKKPSPIDSLLINNSPRFFLIPMSARDEEQLKVLLSNLLAFLNKKEISDQILSSLSYTLQTGRRAMKYRIIFLISTINELKNKLNEFLQNKQDIENCWSNHKKNTEFNINSSYSNSCDPFFSMDLKKVALKWIKGEFEDWLSLYKNSVPSRMRLPVYPFAKERYWITEEIISSETVQKKEQRYEISQSQSLLLKPCWYQKPLSIKDTKTGVYSKKCKEHILVFLQANSDFISQIQINMPEIEIIKIDSFDSNTATNFRKVAIQIFERIQKDFLMKSLNEILLQIILRDEATYPFYHGLMGFLNSAHLENPKFSGQLIELPATVSSTDIIQIIMENSIAYEDHHIRYRNGKRMTAGWQKIRNLSLPEALPWKDQRVYLITGGAGGLGLIVAKEILCNTKKSVIILSGRSPLDESVQDRIAKVEFHGNIVDYQTCDVSDKVSVNNLIKYILNNYGRLDGIIHSAGAVKDNFIIHKNAAVFDEILKPKVDGLINLDEASKELSLDFFILFSSLAAVIGIPGQADYAAANAFMDGYAEYRNELVKHGRRHGQTMSINWPSWHEGGMKVSAEASKLLYKKIGIESISNQEGINLFYKCFSSNAYQIVALNGDLPRLSNVFLSGDDLQNNSEIIKESISRILRVSEQDIDLHSEWMELGFDTVSLSQLSDSLSEFCGLKITLDDYSRLNNPFELINHFYPQKKNDHNESTVTSVPIFPAMPTEDVTIPYDNLFRKKVVDFLKTQLSTVINLPIERIDADSELEEYGIDSIVVMQLTTELEKYFGSLSKTIFFEYKTLSEVAGYFIETFSDKLSAVVSPTDTLNETPKKQKNSSVSDKYENISIEEQSIAAIPENREMSYCQSMPIAIVGLAGKYPKAPSVNDFWENLKSGKDCVIEIPKERWDHTPYYDQDKEKFGKCCTRWGGFLDDVEQFDPLFFNISPQEIEFRDPQERLFLECVHDALEDAGYTRQSLQFTHDDSIKDRVGVFVGVMYMEYQFFGIEEQVRGKPLTLAADASAIANRISYYFDFHGPSIGLDTMCSSSLTAIHLACQSIRTGECRYAIAGGVNLSLHPNKYLMLGMGKFASTDGKCKAFGKGGDGYVPAEGVGAVVLKPLANAIADGDHIYGVIRGTMVNHGGKTNGYAVPNPNAIADVINQAMQNAGVDPTHCKLYRSAWNRHVLRRSN